MSSKMESTKLVNPEHPDTVAERVRVRKNMEALVAMALGHHVVRRELAYPEGMVVWNVIPAELGARDLPLPHYITDPGTAQFMVEGLLWAYPEGIALRVNASGWTVATTDAAATRPTIGGALAACVLATPKLQVAIKVGLSGVLNEQARAELERLLEEVQVSVQQELQAVVAMLTSTGRGR